MDKPLFSDEEIYQLIPQRPPIVMIDKLFSADEQEAETGLHISPQNIFVSEGKMREPGLIEHIAQSAAAFAGYSTFKAGLPPKLGFIGEIKKCHIYLLPAIGTELRTHLEVLGRAAGVTLVAAKTMADEREIADCQMKIFLKD